MKLLLSFFMAILASDQVVNSYRILGIFPIQIKSHWVMQEALMKELASRGHQVDVVTHFPLEKPISNYTDISIKDTLPYLTNNITPVEIQIFQLTSIDQTTKMFGTKLCNLLNHPKLQRLMKSPPQDPPYDLVITEVGLSPCYIAFGRHFNVPVIVTVASVFNDWLYQVSGNPMNPAYIPSIFMPYSQRMNFQERLKNSIWLHYANEQVNYYTNIQLKFVKEHFKRDLSHINDIYKDVALYLVNSHHSLNGIKPMTTNVIEVGGLHLRDDDTPLSPEVQKWLDESKDGCVYFTFGSMVRIETFPKEIIQQIYASFEKIAPIRILMKVAKKEDLLSGLPKNVMTQPWFPQISVLKHKNTRAFITHGGLFGTQEAIYCGIPMIGIPLFADQHINIQNYVNKNVAISLNSITDITEEKLTSALNNILKDPSYRENVQKLSKQFLDRPMSALDTSVFWIEYIVRYGNVLQSPVLNLYWWQQYLLDVYAFILVIIIMILYTVLFILRKLKKLLCGSRICAKKDNAAMNLKKNK